MKTYRGGERVDPGVYFSLRQLSFKDVQDAGPLPGTESEVYRRVPVILMLVVGPILGLAYVIFLPVLGAGLALWFLGVKAVHLARRPAGELVRVLRPGWEPALAFLSRGKRAKKVAAETTDAWAEQARKRMEGDERGSS